MHRFSVTFRAVIRPISLLIPEPLPGSTVLNLIEATSNAGAVWPKLAAVVKTTSPTPIAFISLSSAASVLAKPTGRRVNIHLAVSRLSQGIPLYLCVSVVN
jgi:hypothetical protein